MPASPTPQGSQLTAALSPPLKTARHLASHIKAATARHTTCVYAYLRSEDQTPYYIGVSTGYRRALCQHGHRKHGISVPKDRRYVVVLRGNLTKAQAAAWELFFIKRYGRIDLGTGILRNLSDGGEGMQNPSVETRNRISAFMRQRPVSERQIEAIRSIGLRPKSEQTRRLISLAQKGRTMSASHFANYRRSVDTRVALAAQSKGLSVQEHKAQIKANALEKERQRKALIRQEAASLGMSKRSHERWRKDGCPSELAPYQKKSFELVAS